MANFMFQNVAYRATVYRTGGLPNAYILMCFDRNIKGNRDVKFLECDYLLMHRCVRLTGWVQTMDVFADIHYCIHADIVKTALTNYCYLHTVSPNPPGFFFFIGPILSLGDI